MYGLVVASPEPVKSCTQSEVEVQVEKVCPLWLGSYAVPCMHSCVSNSDKTLI